MVKEIESTKRQIKTLKGNSLFIFNTLMQRFENSFVTFDEVKAIIIERYAKIKDDNKSFKVSRKGETNWGSSKEANHQQYKMASKILKILERITPDNIAELLLEIERLQEASYRSGNSSEIDAARDLLGGVRNQLNSLLYF